MIAPRAFGSFPDVSGTIELAEHPEDSHVEVDIDAASISSGVQQRDEHLRSADFLDVEHFPQLRFVSTAVRPRDGSRFDLVGDLTIKDTTREVVLDAEFLGWGPDPFGATIASFSARGQIDREDWDMTWNVMIETGGLLVGKKVDLEIEAEAHLQPAEA